MMQMYQSPCSILHTEGLVHFSAGHTAGAGSPLLHSRRKRLFFFDSASRQWKKLQNGQIANRPQRHQNNKWKTRQCLIKMCYRSSGKGRQKVAPNAVSEIYRCSDGWRCEVSTITPLLQHGFVSNTGTGKPDRWTRSEPGEWTLVVGVSVSATGGKVKATQSVVTLSHSANRKTQKSINYSKGFWAAAYVRIPVCVWNLCVSI